MATAAGSLSLRALGMSAEEVWAEPPENGSGCAEVWLHVGLW